MGRTLSILAFLTVLFGVLTPGLLHAETLSGGGFVINGGVTSLSGTTALTGGTFVVGGIVTPIGGISSGGVFQVNPPLGSSVAAAAAASVSAVPQGGVIPSLFGTIITPGSAQITSLFITPDTHSVVISFETDIPGDAQIFFGAPGFLSLQTERQPSSSSHVFILQGLTAESLFDFSISVTARGITSSTAPIRFSTLGATVERAIREGISAQAIPGRGGGAAPAALVTAGGGSGRGGAVASGSVIVTGVVQDPSGRLISGARIDVFKVSPDGRKEVIVDELFNRVTTNLYGVYLFQVEPGLYRLVVEKAGYQQGRSSPIDTDALRFINTNIILVPRAAPGAPAAEETAPAEEPDRVGFLTTPILLGLLILLILLLFIARRVIHSFQARS